MRYYVVDAFTDTLFQGNPAGVCLFLAKQLSERGGTLYCAMGETDVKIAGEAKLYLQGEICIS